MRRRSLHLMLVLAVFGSLSGSGTGAQAVDADACAWPMYGQNLSRTFSQTSECSQIDAVTVGSLRPKWFYPTRSPVTAMPSVANGLVYVGTGDGWFYAFAEDPPPGPVEPVWRFLISDRNHNSYGKIVSSAAAQTLTDAGGAETKIVTFGGGSTLYVLDAMTGDFLASSCFDPRPDVIRCGGSDGKVIEIESSPAVLQTGPDEAAIFVGMDYNEAGHGRAGVVRHRLHRDESGWALDPVWKYDPERQLSYTTDISKEDVPGFEVTSTPLKHGGTGYGCGNVWTSPTLDVQNELVYFGTANCSTNRFSDAPEGEFGGEATVAIDINSGALVWCHAPRGVNDDDLDFGATPNILPGGLVGEGGKDGYYYAFPRSRPTGAVDRSCQRDPSWTGHPATAFGIGGITGSTAVGAVTPVGGTPEAAIFATSAIPVPDDEIFDDPGRMMALHAVSAVDGRTLWQAPNPFPSYGSVVYTNGVVFAPHTFAFSIWAYHADTGVPLWRFPLNGAPSSSPAVVGDSIYMGTGTTVDPFPLEEGSGVWAFQLATSVP